MYYIFIYIIYIYIYIYTHIIKSFPACSLTKCKIEKNFIFSLDVLNCFELVCRDVSAKPVNVKVRINDFFRYFNEKRLQ